MSDAGASGKATHLREVEIDIHNAETKACANTIAKLEAALQLAKEGHLHGVMIAGELTTGEFMVTWTEAMDWRRRLATLEAMKLDWYATISGWTKGEG